MNKHFWIVCAVLVLLGMSCNSFSLTAPASTPEIANTSTVNFIDKSSVTAVLEDITTHPPVAITPQPAQSAKVIFADDFSSPTSGWTRANQDGHVLSYSEGTYLIMAPMREQGWVDVGLSPMKFTDAVLSVDFQIVSEDSGNTCAIVAWRVQDWKNYYALMLSDKGFVNVSRLVNGQFIPIYDWKKVSALNMDHQANHIDIVFTKENSTVYINQELVTKFKDVNYTVGAVGLGALSATDSAIQVRFDNVILYDSKEWAPPTSW
jgi:hypothetical protein